MSIGRHAAGGGFGGRVGDPIGVSIGTSNLVAVRVGRAPVSRRAVLTLFGHLPAEVGTAEENGHPPDPDGMVVRGFVERVGDPVPLVVGDGASYRGETLLATALSALLDLVGGAGAGDVVTIAAPAHWSRTARTALQAALAADPRLAAIRPALVPDTLATLTALHADPGLPDTGVIALLDFGASGTGLTLVDAATGFTPIGETQRLPFSGDEVDAAVLRAVLTDLERHGDVDPAATAAVGSLVRLRHECRVAKERLSAEPAVSLVAALPGHHSEVRFTRAELDSLVAPELDGVCDALVDFASRHGVLLSRLSAVATVGGGAAMPIVTQRLSELLSAPVVTTPRAELNATIGAALLAARGDDPDAPTGIS